MDSYLETLFLAFLTVPVAWCLLVSEITSLAAGCNVKTEWGVAENHNKHNICLKDLVFLILNLNFFNK